MITDKSFSAEKIKDCTLIYLTNAQDGINEASLIKKIPPACLIRLKKSSKEAKSQKSISEAAPLLDS